MVVAGSSNAVGLLKRMFRFSNSMRQVRRKGSTPRPRKDSPARLTRAKAKSSRALAEHDRQHIGQNVNEQDAVLEIPVPRGASMWGSDVLFHHGAPRDARVSGAVNKTTSTRTAVNSRRR